MWKTILSNLHIYVVDEDGIKPSKLAIANVIKYCQEYAEKEPNNPPAMIAPDGEGGAFIEYRTPDCKLTKLIEFAPDGSIQMAAWDGTTGWEKEIEVL